MSGVEVRVHPRLWFKRAPPRTKGGASSRSRFFFFFAFVLKGVDWSKNERLHTIKASSGTKGKRTWDRAERASVCERERVVKVYRNSKRKKRKKSQQIGDSTQKHEANKQLE